MPPLHPATVHFPIGLLLANALLTVLYLRSGNRSLEISAYHCLVLGWFGAVVATLAGSIDAWRQVYSDPSIRNTALINWVNGHAASGLSTVWIYGMALLRRRRNQNILDDPQQRGGYLRLLALGVVAVVVGGWLGGQLVYTFGLGVKG
ncbi:MAG: DUF2231 domain-containing protein [Chloroflexaceae bacterium]|nr:DUF2231 domain-containing protein [Chloroflexaceae bacterium]NJO04514.1 DUF2231 domain-containing protein [Chloroflexaceae bacterium]